MSTFSGFARWFCSLLSPRRVDPRRPSSRLEDGGTSDSALATPPTYIAYHVTATPAGEHGEQLSVWSRVGAAWLHIDGKGFTVVLDVVPLNGRFILREPLELEPADGLPLSEMM